MNPKGSFDLHLTKVSEIIYMLIHMDKAYAIWCYSRHVVNNFSNELMIPYLVCILQTYCIIYITVHYCVFYYYIFFLCYKYSYV
jgi:hypothetical protein